MVFQQKLLGKAYFIVKMLLQPWSGRPVLTFGKRPKSASKISPPSLCGLNLGTTACNVAVRYESILSSFCFTLFVLKFSIGFSSAPSYNSITIPNSPSWRYDRKSTVYHPFRGQLRKRMHGTTTQRNICKVNHREKII